MTVLLDTPMARQKRNDEPTKIDKDVLDLARIVAAYRKVQLAEYLTEIIRPIVQADLIEEQRIHAAEPQKKPRK